MFSFFKDAGSRNTFFKGFLACIVGSVIIVGRVLGKHGHPDETTIYLFIGIVILSILILSWIIDRNYHKTLKKQKKK